MDNKNSIGRRLKEAREKKSLTIEQVQKQSKIHSSVLKALEEGHASTLLTDTYVRSFLKKYSQLLGLPTADILKEYFPPHQESPSPNVSFDDNPLPYETKAGPRVLYFTGIAVFGIAALLVAVFIGAKLVSSFNKAKLTQHEKRIAAASASKKRQPKSAVNKTAQKKKTAAKAGSAPKYIIPKSAQLSLVIRVKEPVLVKLTRDGVLIFSRVMTKDLVETVTASESIELEIGKAQALDLTLNGSRIELPARSSIRGLSITRKGVRLK